MNYPLEVTAKQARHSGSLRRKGPRPAEDKVPSELGKRILQAAEHGGFSQTALERVLVSEGALTQGYLSRIIYGDRGNSSIGLQILARIAKLCDVDFEWLAIGEGPLRARKALDALTPTPPSDSVVRKKKGDKDK